MPPSIDLNDTQRQFRDTSDRQLRKAFWIFWLMSWRQLSVVGQWLIGLALHLRWRTAEKWVRDSIFEQFCGGESITGTKARVSALSARNIATILDYSVESAESEAARDGVREELVSALVHAEEAGIPFIALKVTGLCDSNVLAKKQANEPLTPQEATALDAGFMRLNEICRCAATRGRCVFVDAEHSWIQDTIDEWALQMIELYNRQRVVVYTTLQMYRVDRLDYLKELLANPKLRGHQIGLKVVRGAYMEQERNRAGDLYPSPIQPDRASTDRDFDAAIDVCLNHIDRVALCAGTHNIDSAMKLAKIIDASGIQRSHKHVLFAQLLGMSDNISFNLAEGGFNVAKYLPYGPVQEVLPYLFRRAAENTSTKDQTSRELLLIKKEIARRKTLAAESRGRRTR